MGWEGSMQPNSKQFAAYVPALILQHLGDNHAPPSDTSGHRLRAVAVFADYAGSTKIANELTRLGRLHGPEEMYRIFNAYYEPLVTQLNGRGGDVIGFAGDAVVAVWPMTDDGSLTPAVRQATQVSLELQQSLNNLELAPGVRLAMRICIGVGELSTALVGGRQGFWQLVASGEPLDQIRDAGSLARIGEVIISREVHALLGPADVFDQQPDGSVFVRQVIDPPPMPPPLTDVSTLPEAVLRLFVQRNVQASIDAGVGEYLSQARMVSVLFVRVGRRAGEPQSYHFVQEAMSLVQEAAFRYEGIVAQFIEDDKGLVALLAFGLPMAGHEDDPRRAIETALFLQDPANSRGVPCAIGASTGLPFCGALGSPGRRVVYTVTGSDVVRAARLMQLAHYGEVLCDEDTHTAVSKNSQHRYQPLPRFKLKGYDHPARVFRVSKVEGSRAHSVIPRGQLSTFAQDAETINQIACDRLHAKQLGARLTALLRERAEEEDTASVILTCDRLLAEDVLVTDNGVCELTDEAAQATPTVSRNLALPLIGRAAECAVLANALAEVESGNGRVILVEGDSGAGKSRLLEEAARLSQERGMSVGVGHCSSVESSTPYFPWRAVCENFLDLGEHSPQAERGERVLATLAKSPDVLPYASLLNDLLGLALPENDVTAQMAGQNRADNLSAALVGLIASATDGRPAFIILEDFQWADTSSWRLVKTIRERLSSILLAVSFRPETDNPLEYEPLLTSKWTHRLVLDPLSEKDTREFARMRFGSRWISEPLARLVWERSRGNPLYIEQITGHLADTELVVMNGELAELRLSATGVVEAAIPDTIRGLLTARIDRLPPVHQLTVKVSSVIGPLFNPNTLIAIFPDPDKTDSIPEHIISLTRERLYRLDRPPPDAMYEFPHPVLQQVCYELLTRPQRQQLHHHAAEWYQSDQTGTGPQYRLIAHHWGKAKFVDKQTEFLARAGEAAIRDGAFHEAATGFREILHLSHEQFANPSPEEIARRAHWEHQLGEAYFGLGDLPRAAGHFRESLLLRGRTCRSSRPGQVVDTLAQFLRQLSRRMMPRFSRADLLPDELGREIAATYLRLGRISYYQNDILAGTNATLRALNSAEKIGPSPQLALAYASVTILTGLLNWRKVAGLYSQLAEETVRAVGNIQERCIVLEYLCMHNLGQGNWDRVNLLAREALRLAERISDHTNRSEGASILAMKNCFHSDYPAAVTWTATIIDGAKRSGNVMHAAWATNILAEADFRQGRSEEAIVRLNESAAALRGNKDRTEEIRIGGMLAALAVRSGDLAAAIRHAEATEVVIREASAVTCSTLEGLAGVAEARFTQAEQSPSDSKAFQAAKTALPALKKHAKLYPIGRPRHALYEGRLHMLKGAPTRALRAWRAGVESAAALRLLFDEALLHDILYRHTAPGTDERRVHFDEATRLYEQVGAVIELQRLKESASASALKATK
ncbi:MAG: hypothetical protein C0467_29775 [Planctomycetaceae bacterium]|nr:hypothetical protein [Planctomycetaceae bacterium]